MKTKLLALLTIAQVLFGWQLFGHPLGVLSTNRYTRIEIAPEKIRLIYVLDIAEVPSIQEFALIDRNHDGTICDQEREDYMAGKEKEIRENLQLVVDDSIVAIRPVENSLEFPTGQGALRTIRFSPVYEASLDSSGRPHTLRFVDRAPLALRGWREIVARAGVGEVMTSSSASTDDVTNALRNYPADRLDNPPVMTEATLEFRAGETGTAMGLVSLAQITIQRTTDSFSNLVTATDMGTAAVVIALLFALLLGAGHALTPGHGKTIVAAYLVGSRGTARDAVILGLTVTITHTAGVFALGVITLVASQYIMPATLFPWLGLLSGVIVIWIGASLFFRRLQHAVQARRGDHDEHDGHVHTHGGKPHSHGLPPSSDGATSLSRLLALGVSGGLLPCPSAIVVLLGAVALGRVWFGLLLVLAFSAGLAGVLTALGILMVYSRRLFTRIRTEGFVFRWVPVLSAMVIAVAGIVIAYQAGRDIPFFREAGVVSCVSLLGLGFVLGLKHALDADHLVAVSTIVSEHKGLFSSSLVGGLWGLGHTASLIAAGLVVIALHISIPEKLAQALEFSVATMLVLLGINALRKVLGARVVHLHPHNHGDHTHVHPHIHPGGHDHDHVPVRLTFMEHLRRSKRSVFIGMVHGLAGSAALMLVVVAAIPSTGIALLYICVFGLGSVGGMLVMSTLMGLPFVLTLHGAGRLNLAVRTMSGIVSVLFGLFLAWQIGFMDGLFL